MILKTCTKCKERKPHSEFHKDNRAKDGLQSWCKGCIKQNKEQYYKENVEKIKQQQKQYRKENVEKIKQREKQYIKNQPAVVYKIENTKTGRVYIGQTTQCKKRWRNNTSALRRNKHRNPKLQEDYYKYGLDVFEFKIIKEFPSDTTSDVLLKEEIKMITEYNQRGENLYNIMENEE